jgi:PAT family beta-lactamase induction signal transducer AmpG
LPWSLKFINGFLVDRYTFLPMGRRRIWVVGAQIVVLAIMIIAALLPPQPNEIFLLASLGFGMTLAITFQDIGVDALAIDVMEDSERATGAGIMYGSQIIGISLTTGLGGWLINSFGFSLAIISLTLVPAFTLLYGLVIIERAGEKNLPWGQGKTHPFNRERQIKAWRPLLKQTLSATFGPVSLLVIPLLFIRSIGIGVSNVFVPTLFTTHSGWSTTSYSEFYALMALVAGIWGMLLGGKIVKELGKKNVIAFCSGSLCVLYACFAALPMLWTEKWFLVSFVIAVELIGITTMIAVVPICMRLCVPAVVASQFIIYMSIANFGISAGALLASVTAGQGHEQLLFWVLSLFMALFCLWSIFAKALYSLNDPKNITA